MNKKTKYQKIAVLVCALALLIVPGAMALPDALVPGGHTAGVQMRCGGVLVVALTPVETENGSLSPAEAAGVLRGDVITQVNGQKIENVSQLTEAVRQAEQAELCLLRNGSSLTLTVSPVESSGVKRLGLLARDGIAGIGTITFYDPETGTFGALGHGINDADTLQLIPMGDGTLIYSTVAGVRKGKSGDPGELQGDFPGGAPIGTLSENDTTGIYGTLLDPSLLQGQELLPVAEPQEVVPGEAFIYSNVDGDMIREYAIEILRVYPESAGEERNMMIRVTDPALLETTGGIVQGMSGSPIVQNGKLIGAVTHVLVDDPTRGYGIFIENMLEAAA